MDRDDRIRREQGERLKAARAAAGYRSARYAALDNGWPESTYRAHEGGTRTIGIDDANRYLRIFRAKGVAATAQSILFGETETEAQNLESPQAAEQRNEVQLVGYVSAGTAHFVPSGELGTAPLPAPITKRTVAVEIRGDSLGEVFDRWLVFYDDVRRPITDDLIGQLCIVGLSDGRVLIKQVKRAKKGKGFDLHSQSKQKPILNADIEWAGRVKQMVPRQ